MTTDAQRAKWAASRAAWCRRNYTHGPDMIDATGTRRRIQALATLGWSSNAVAAKAGMRGSDVRDIVYDQERVYITTAAIISQVYVALENSLAPMTTTPQRASAGQARSVATRNGWAPPIAWDDIDNDPEPADLTHLQRMVDYRPDKKANERRYRARIA